MSVVIECGKECDAPETDLYPHPAISSLPFSSPTPSPRWPDPTHNHTNAGLPATLLRSSERSSSNVTSGGGDRRIASNRLGAREDRTEAIGSEVARNVGGIEWVGESRSWCLRVKREESLGYLSRVDRQVVISQTEW